MRSKHLKVLSLLLPLFSILGLQESAAGNGDQGIHNTVLVMSKGGEECVSVEQLKRSIPVLPPHQGTSKQYIMFDLAPNFYISTNYFFDNPPDKIWFGVLVQLNPRKYVREFSITKKSKLCLRYHKNEDFLIITGDKIFLNLKE